MQLVECGRPEFWTPETTCNIGNKCSPARTRRRATRDCQILYRQQTRAGTTGTVGLQVSGTPARNPGHRVAAISDTGRVAALRHEGFPPGYFVLHMVAPTLRDTRLRSDGSGPASASGGAGPRRRFSRNRWRLYAPLRVHDRFVVPSGFAAFFEVM